VTDRDRFDRLATVVAECQDRERGRSFATLSQRRARFIDAVRHPPPRQRWPRVATGKVLAAAALVVVFLFVFLRPAEEISFTVDAGPGMERQWIMASTEPVDVSFSEGSSLVLAAHSKARVEPNPDGVQIVLESGSVALRLRRESQIHWQVDAGPFVTRVTGTRFTVEWDPHDRTFRTAVTEGRASVEGPMWISTQVVTAGQSIEAVLPRPTVTAIREEPPQSAPPTMDTVADEPPPPTPEPRSSKKAGWETLAANGEHRAALAAAEAAGFERLCGRLDANGLLRLADAARYARSAPRATQALESLRKRFAGTRQATMAAYTLGLVWFDLQRDYGKAARSFRTYLDEQPGGALGEEAMGRLIEAYQRGGRRRRAREVAEDYLARFPRGAHAGLANELLTP
jgi:hypothetical protein